MSIVSFKAADRLLATPARAQPRGWGDEGLALHLMAEGVLQPDALLGLMRAQGAGEGGLAALALASHAVPEADLFASLARFWQVPAVDPQAQPADPRLIDRLGTGFCLREGMVPWRRQGGVTLVAVPDPARFAAFERHLAAVFGAVAPVLAPPRQIEAALLAARGPQMEAQARLALAEPESCRSFGRGPWAPKARLVLMGLVAWALLAPLSLGLAVLVWALLTLALTTALKLAATLAALIRPPPEAPPPALRSAGLPQVSIIVALYREDSIAQRLVKRLQKLDYPRDKLEILLVVEEEDSLTRGALDRAALPPWMRVVVAPEGNPKTKPRALNHALGACRGAIVGIYDAEDAPEPDQIRKVVQRFQARGPQVACLQGVLDFYNPCSNWISRCFTMEYAAWFRLMLPGLERLGVPLPLGGTTLFFRRDALEKLGAWDAYNVTEDADLGIRLARHGYRTEMIDTTTFEEANCRAYPWVKQRSRWIKGYMMTWVVHSRRPAGLLHAVGWRGFAGFQVFFLGAISQQLLAPVLWSFWLLALGLPHPLAAAAPAGLIPVAKALFLASEAVQLGAALLALRRTPNRMAPGWVLMLHLYFPLATLAAYKAAWELVTRPFWWDKTSHGHFDPPH